MNLILVQLLIKWMNKCEFQGIIENRMLNGCLGKLDLYNTNSKHTIISHACHGPSSPLFHFSKVGNYDHGPAKHEDLVTAAVTSSSMQVRAYALPLPI